MGKIMHSKIGIDRIAPQMTGVFACTLSKFQHSVFGVYLAQCAPGRVCTWDSIYLSQCVPGTVFTYHNVHLA